MKKLTKQQAEAVIEIIAKHLEEIVHDDVLDEVYHDIDLITSARNPRTVRVRPDAQA